MTEYDETREPTRVLTEDECWKIVREAPYGRIAAGAAGEIDIFPINHAVDGPVLVFRTLPGTKLLELTIRSQIAFEVDGYTDDEAYSVVIKGRAEEFDHSIEVESAERLGLEPWAPEPKDRWVRITPTSIEGRWFERPRRK